LTTLKRNLAYLWLSLWAACAFATPSFGQVPSVLEEVKLVTEDARQASFLLRFSPREPDFAPLNENPSQPALTMRSSLRAPSIAEQTSYKGIVRSTRLSMGDGNLLMRFDTVAPARVSAEKVGALTVKVTVERVSEAEATGIQPIGSAGDEVVKTSDLGPADYYNPNDSYELVFLKYADVSEVIGLLVEGTTIEPNNVFIRREPGFGSPGANSQTNNNFNNNAASDKKDRPLGQSFGNGLAIDRRLNAIWVRGTPERIASVKSQIALIDVPVDSVILETQFVELSELGARAIGLDLNNSAGQIASGRIDLVGQSTYNQSAPNQVYASGVLQAAIYAQVQKGQGRIVSRPRIAALSGSTAKIITGDAIPILTSILSGLNAVSQQVQYVNVGVTLQIAPRVSSDGFVTSQIYGVVSSVTGTSQGYPTISQREAETSASVRDGETFVIGGLTQENNLTNKSKVPLVGDIPLVGNLFKLEKSTRSRTELYIVITPHIVRHRRFEKQPDDASVLSPSPPSAVAPPMPMARPAQ
jgi:general secretion pathway protein D